MKAILICPAERPAVTALSETMPLVLVPMLGKNLVDYWMEHLAARGFSEATILAADRPEKVRQHVGAGERWGVKTEVLPVTHEINETDARALVANGTGAQCVVLMEYLPQLPAQKLFDSYNSWFSALSGLMQEMNSDTRIGVHEIKPGIWTSLHDAISPEARLVAPCWIGRDVTIEEGAVVGPFAIIEDGVCVEKEAEVAHSVVLSDTLVGEFTEISNSVAWGDMLTHIPDGISARVPDEFLLSPLNEEPLRTPRTTFIGRVAAAALLVAIAPFAILAMIRSMLNGRAYLRVKTAVKPCLSHSDKAGATMTYCEVPSRYGWIRRWPQLWEAVCGRFALVGNRPLSPEDAAELKHDYEKLWLSVPTGVISLADAAVGVERFDEKARAHACFYAIRADEQMDASILYAVVIGRPLNAIRSTVKDVMPVPVRYAELDGQS
ncbi:MAG: hypothetical protein K0Q55_2641 [Verrucomicrobia bacterium]|jgi:hypothetical protein|nr:hypothetical protein [Verrucomicrobiota bacterium]